MKSIPRHGIKTERGFTLLEMSMVLIAIALIVGATTIGTNLHRDAAYQKIATVFIRGWQLSYLSYFNTIGVVPGDTPATPTGMVNHAANSPLCGSNGSTGLRDVMYAAGVKMPVGRAEGFEDHDSYLDSNGNPQDVVVCFENVPWSVPGSSAGTYVVQQKNVMVISRLTPDLARMLDSMIDGVPDARFGDFRENVNAALTSTTSLEWSIDNRRNLNTGTDDNFDEAQVGYVTAYYLMNP
jgi:prepilin-type N-terminal cleavage/methylation domain-containing protein